jgi:quercetin dioxygenase-like cupin family protein
MVVADGGVVTAGAAFAHIDLALALVRRVSPCLAEHVARLLVIDERASQSAYLVVDHLSHDDRLVRAFEQQARARLGEALDICELAAAIGISERTLERRTRAALGMSPLALVQRLRAERAVHLLRTTAQEPRADRAAGGLRQCVHPPCPAAAIPDGPASQAIARGQEPSHVRVGAARFTRSVRAAWHCHAVGQTLYITEGHGLRQPRGGQIEEIRAGDIICTPVGEWHWHGAAPDHLITHPSTTEAVPGEDRGQLGRAHHRRGLPPALMLSGAPFRFAINAAHRHDRRRTSRSAGSAPTGLDAFSAYRQCRTADPAVMDRLPGIARLRSVMGWRRVRSTLSGAGWVAMLRTSGPERADLGYEPVVPGEQWPVDVVGAENLRHLGRCSADRGWLGPAFGCRAGRS